MTRKVQTKADKIRALAKEGHSYAEIARTVGVRPQHVWNVLGPKGGKRRGPISAVPPREFRSEFLLRGGFQDIGEWSLTDDRAVPPPRAPVEPGVYAFVLDDVVVYVGSTERGLRDRMRLYERGDSSQATNARIKNLIQDSLAGKRRVRVLVATPGCSQWNGLPVSIAAGLEAALIQMIQPKWNKRLGR